jgi:hypothetical protein
MKNIWKQDRTRKTLRKLQKGELHNLYSSLNISRQIKSRRMTWVGHVVCIGEAKENCRWFWWESPKEGDNFEDIGGDRTMGSEWISGDWLGRGCGVDTIGSG